MDYALSPRSGRRLCLLCLAMFSLFTLAPFVPAYFGSLYSVWVRALALLLLGAYFSHRRLRDGWELRLLTAWCLWAALVQIFHGDLSLLDSWEYLFNMASQILWLALPLLLQRTQRLRLLDGLAVVFTLVFSLLACLCLYGTLSGQSLHSPLSGEPLFHFTEKGAMYALNQNPNIVGHWFFLDFWLAAWLFLRSRWLLVRLPAVLAALLAWLCVALTGSRNAMLGLSVCLGLGLAALLLCKLPLRRRSLQALTLLLVLGLSVPLLWKSFPAVGNLVLSLPAEAAAPAAEAGDPAAQLPRIEDADFHDSGRIPIWTAALRVLGEEPLRLLTGDPSAMDATNAMLQRHWPFSYEVKNFAHHHSSFLQVLMTLGLPGLGLMAGLMLLLLGKMGRLFLQTWKAEPALCAPVLCLLGAGQYNLLETCLFFASDIRCILFFLLAGMVIACSRDAQEKAKSFLTESK